jgi:hypothetical protein
MAAGGRVRPNSSPPHSAVTDPLGTFVSKKADPVRLDVPSRCPGRYVADDLARVRRSGDVLRGDRDTETLSLQQVATVPLVGQESAKGSHCSLGVLIGHFLPCARRYRPGPGHGRGLRAAEGSMSAS